jgi:hypothetical protein
MIFLTELFMEKNFTLMKTLTAVCSLVFPRSRKNSRTVTNGQTSLAGCGINTTVNNHLNYTNDAKQSDASFLFFEQAVINDQHSTVDAPRSIDNDQKLKSKEELSKVNDELAQRNAPKPAYNNWRERVNDDMAACGPVVSPESVVVTRESITVIDVLKNIFSFSNTIVHNETMTTKNDAFRPFASFFISAVVRFFKQDHFSKNSKPVFIPVRICDKSKMRFSQNRFNKN